MHTASRAWTMGKKHETSHATLEACSAHAKLKRMNIRLPPLVAAQRRSLFPYLHPSTTTTLLPGKER
eukprot:4619634-Pleurochrysis_carterae.AAC.2